MEELRLVWLSLLSDANLSAVRRIAPLCKWESKPPLLPFYTVQDVVASPRDSLWVHVPSGSRRPSPNFSWVEVAHCAHPRTNGGQPAWKNAPMWFYAAPGSSVSLNVGVTAVVPTWRDAAALLQKVFARAMPRMPRSRLRCEPATASRGLRHLDTIQIVSPRQEYFSREPRHELVWLRHPECAPLTPGMPGIMCGRWPHLTPCSDSSPGLRLMARCHHAGQAELSPRVRRAIGRPLPRFSPGGLCSSSSCFRGADGKYRCPARTSTGMSEQGATQ
jgi:hypothetical protein